MRTIRGVLFPAQGRVMGTFIVSDFIFEARIIHHLILNKINSETRSTHVPPFVTKPLHNRNQNFLSHEVKHTLRISGSSIPRYSQPQEN